MKDMDSPNSAAGEKELPAAVARFVPVMVFGLRAAALAGIVVTAAAGLGGAFDAPIILADSMDPPHPSTCCLI